METIKLVFKITSQESNVEFTTIAEHKNNRIKFEDLDNIMNYVIIKKDIIEYYKKGDVDMKYIFDLDRVTKGYYRVMNTELTFEIVTNTLLIKNGKIFVEYDLYQEQERVNQSKLSLVYESKEES